MKKLLLILTILIFIGCDKEQSLQNIPECAKTAISLAMQYPPRTPAYSISKYKDPSGHFLYKIDAVPTNARDYPVEYYDEQCSLVYAVGGISGVFPAGSLPSIENLTFVETVWTDPR